MFSSSKGIFSNIVVEICFCEDVRLFWHVMINHVKCAELQEVQVYADGNREMCQRASHLKEGVLYALEELHVNMKVIQTQKLIGRLRWLQISNSEKSECFVKF
jgi:hypothetical protein